MTEVNNLVDEAYKIKEERDALLRFKQWVHGFLDAHGVPHHPPGSHGAEGCRIGDRMDWLMERLRSAEAERDQFRKDAADAAALRRAFNAAVAAFQEAGKQLKPLREGEPPPAGERALMAPWQKLYEAVRDTQAGLGILAENAAHVGEMAAVLDDYADTFAEDQCGVAESHGIWLDLNYDRVQELEAAAIAALAPDAAQRALARLRALEQAADFLRTIRLARWGDGPAFWEVDEANLRFVLTALDAGK
jgi:hypothetical protein